MPFRTTLKREFQVAFSKKAQPLWFRIMKYAMLGGLIYLMWGRSWMWIVLTTLAAISLITHFWYRYKTRGWTQSYGGWSFENS